jgi:hypothetical protein
VLPPEPPAAGDEAGGEVGEDEPEGAT